MPAAQVAFAVHANRMQACVCEASQGLGVAGSGIFRHVHLVTTPEVHIGLFGVVTRTEVADDNSAATVSVSVRCENNGTSSAPKPGLTATIMDAGGKTVATGTADVPAIAAGASQVVNVTGLKVVARAAALACCWVHGPISSMAAISSCCLLFRINSRTCSTTAGRKSEAVGPGRDEHVHRQGRALTGEGCPTWCHAGHH